MIYSVNELHSVITDFKDDDVIVFPTDTVYGIGAKFQSSEGVSKIFEIKNRPSEKSLIILCANMAQLEGIVGTLTDEIKKLVDAFLPGGLTLILKPNIDIIDEITRKKQTIGVRIPNHEVALSILEQLGPLATTSANISGEASPTIVDNSNLVVQRSKFVIDGGQTLEKVPSTILDCTQTPPRIIREGKISVQMIENCLNER